MSRVSVKMDGLDELRNRLKSFSNPDPIVNTALEKAGEHLRSAIEDSTPVRTGKLKAAIIKGGVINKRIQIGPSQQGPAFRAHFLEFGTSKMSAQPFMRPAFEVSKSKIEQIMAEEIRKGLGI